MKAKAKTAAAKSYTISTKGPFQVKPFMPRAKISKKVLQAQQAEAARQEQLRKAQEALASQTSQLQAQPAQTASTAPAPAPATTATPVVAVTAAAPSKEMLDAEALAKVKAEEARLEEERRKTQEAETARIAEEKLEEEREKAAEQRAKDEAALAKELKKVQTGASKPDEVEVEKKGKSFWKWPSKPAFMKNLSLSPRFIFWVIIILLTLTVLLVCKNHEGQSLFESLRNEITLPSTTPPESTRDDVKVHTVPKATHSASSTNTVRAKEIDASNNSGIQVIGDNNHVHPAGCCSAHSVTLPPVAHEKEWWEKAAPDHTELILDPCPLPSPKMVFDGIVKTLLPGENGTAFVIPKGGWIATPILDVDKFRHFQYVVDVSTNTIPEWVRPEESAKVTKSFRFRLVDTDRPLNITFKLEASKQ